MLPRPGNVIDQFARFVEQIPDARRQRELSSRKRNSYNKPSLFRFLQRCIAYSLCHLGKVPTPWIQNFTMRAAPKSGWGLHVLLKDPRVRGYKFTDVHPPRPTLPVLRGPASASPLVHGLFYFRTHPSGQSPIKHGERRTEKI